MIVRLLAAFLLVVGASAASRPNIVFILADDLGYGDVGCFGAKDIRTPHLDEMAAAGLKLTSFYAQPICGPSRAALMTGCYPLRVGEVNNAKNGHTLPHPKEVTLAEVLSKAGYRTGIIGKWHLGMGPGCSPAEQGFQSGYFTPAFNGATRNIRPKASFPFLRARDEVARVIRTQAEMDTITGDCTREALAFIRASQDKPFFLYLAYHMPHVPLGASKAFRGKSARGLYGDAVQELDASVGKVLAELKSLGLAANTLVVFTSDNGPWTDPQIGDHGGSPGPFRGGKMTTWEGGWRVPCIVSWPGRVRAGETSDGIVSIIDWFPTFARLAEVKTPSPAGAGITVDGIDLTDLLTTSGAKSPRETHLYHNGARLAAVRHQGWKLLLSRPAGGQMPYMPGFVTSHLEALPADGLYDIAADPTESTNLARERPDIVRLLGKIATEARAELGDYDGPGSGARFHEAGPRWPLAAQPNAAK